MDYINYENKNDDLLSKLDIKIGSRKYFADFEDDIPLDPFNPFKDSSNNTSILNTRTSTRFSSLHEDEFDPISFNHSSLESELTHAQQSTRIKNEESNTSFDDVTVNGSVPDPISSKSKRIQKREKAKQRSQANKPKITEEAVLSGDIPAKYIPPEFNEANLDEKSKKKMLQKIRNRISAQNSRDRKRNLIDGLESQQRELIEENLRLKSRVRQLEEVNAQLQKENAQLQKENQEFKIALTNPFSVEHHNALHSENRQSIELGGGNSPVFRAGNRSGNFMKYSLALATIFAVVMFTGMGPVPNQQALGTMLSVLPQQAMLQIPAPLSPVRILKEEPDSFPSSNSKDLMVMMLEEQPDKQRCVSTNLADYAFVNQMNDLQKNFHEKYMSKFASQIKVDPLILQHNKEHQMRISARSPDKALMEYNFSTHLRSTRRQFPDTVKVKDPSKTQLALPFTDSDSMIPALTGENFSSVFCPAGFEFQTEDQESNTSNPAPQKKLKLEDSEWLQLFFPKNNMSIVNSGSQNELTVTSLSNSQIADGTMLEVWCKVFYVRELPSRL